MNESGQQMVLLISALPGAENLAEVLVNETLVEARVARTAKSALAVLRREEFTVVVIDTSTIPPEVATLVSQRSGLATVLEADVRVAGGERILREVAGVLQRRAREGQAAREQAAHAVQDEIRQDVTALLLQTELMLRETTLSPKMARKLETLRSLTDALRVRLRSA